MAAGTALAVASIAASTGLGIYKASEGAKMRRDAKDSIDDYEREELRNVYAGITLPVERARLEREEVNQARSEVADVATRAGARGLSLLPRIQERSSQDIAKIGAQLEESQFRIQQMIAEDEKRIQTETARREEADLAGLGQAYEVGRQDEFSGYGDIVEGIGALSQVLSAPKTDQDKDKYNPFAIGKGTAITEEQTWNLA